MKKLKNKIFFTIFLILTLSFLTVIVIFNVQNYNQEKNLIKNNLEMINNNFHKIDNKPNEPKQDMPVDRNLKFLDSTIYTIMLDENDNIIEIVNHSQNLVTNSKISELAKEILAQKNIKKISIKFLYFSNYSYIYTSNSSLIILDNTNIKNRLITYLETSLIIFLILEILIFLIASLITKWLIKPVDITFSKQKQFIADASHELKTPLSVIIASSEALEDDKNIKKWLKIIKDEANRMNHLITNLLELARSETNLKANFEFKNLSKVIELTVLNFEGKIYEKKLKLSYDIKDNIFFKIDENNIRQLLEILLDNAICHSSKNGEIQVILTDNSKEISLEVKNSGVEIPHDEEEKIFERFYRSDTSRNRKDNRYGLGLAIAKNIVLNHQGIIKAKSSQGITTFKVLFKKNGSLH